MGNTSEISKLLASLTAQAANVPTRADDLVEEMTVFPLPRYPKFSIANFERDLHRAAPNLEFQVCDLSFDYQNERTDGMDVQKLCVTFKPAADYAIATPLVMQAIQNEYVRKGMPLGRKDLTIEYSPNNF